jgi:hypothetical protein
MGCCRNGRWQSLHPPDVMGPCKPIQQALHAKVLGYCLTKALLALPSMHMGYHWLHEPVDAHPGFL